MRSLLWMVLASAIIGCTVDQDDSSSERTFPSSNADQLAFGEQVYAEYCAACHGPNGEGQRPDAPLSKDETGRFPAPPHDLTGHTWHHGDDLLIRIIREGATSNPKDFYEMPAFGDVLNDEEIAAVLALIKGWWTDEPRTAQQMQTDAMRNAQ